MFENRKKKISIIGAGNAGCISALYYYYYEGKKNCDLILYHDPTIPMERVGQGSTVPTSALIANAFGLNWNNNSIGATFKTGIMYEGWGKNKGNHFHEIDMNGMAMHFVPQKLSQLLLESGIVKVVEKNIKDPEKELDSDFIIDCRGRNNKNEEDYETLINPLNAVLLCNKPGSDLDLKYTRTVATPNGWTFVIPMCPESPSHNGAVGYLYNTNITSREDAEKNFLEMFDVEITNHINFKNYVAKNPVVDDRIFLNGNRLFFLEPLESTAIGAYLDVVRWSFDVLFVRNRTFNDASKGIKQYIEQIQNFILWHYQFGSKYDTPFWKYAKTLTFKDPDFNWMLKESRKFDQDDVMPPDYGGDPKSEHVNYAQWFFYSFKNWDYHMTQNI